MSANFWRCEFRWFFFFNIFASPTPSTLSWCFKCRFRCDECLYVLSHCEQTYGRSPLCTSICLLILNECRNGSLHMGHWCRMCCCIWLRTHDLSTNVHLHMSQLNGRSSVCTRRWCRFLAAFCSKLFLQTSHSNCFCGFCGLILKSLRSDLMFFM